MANSAFLIFTKKYIYGKKQGRIFRRRRLLMEGHGDDLRALGQVLGCPILRYIDEHK